MLATRAYALLFVLTLLTAAAVEFVPRGEPARLGSRPLRAQLAKREATEQQMQERIGRGEMEENDADALAAVRDRIAELRSEVRLRSIRDGAFVALALGSVLFVIVGGLQSLLRKRPAPKSGDVEIEPDEDLEIDPVEVAYELGKLHTTRAAAIAMLLDQPSLVCGYCKTRWRPDVLGRIGKRVLVARAPVAVAKPERQILGEGWWMRPAEPPPCVKCGGRDLLPE